MQGYDIMKDGIHIGPISVLAFGVFGEQRMGSNFP